VNNALGARFRRVQVSTSAPDSLNATKSTSVVTKPVLTTVSRVHQVASLATWPAISDASSGGGVSFGVVNALMQTLVFGRVSVMSHHVVPVVLVKLSPALAVAALE